METQITTRRSLLAMLFGAVAAVAAAGCTPTIAADAPPASGQQKNNKQKATKKMSLPITKQEIPVGKEIATLGAGCFWCVEAVFLGLKGVEKVESGYSGGQVPNPTYDAVCGGRTGHAEVIQVTFDPKVIGFDDILRVFFTTHDPTTLNRQGADSGTQYRSAIFTHSDAQKATAEKIKAEITAEKVYKDPVVTEITPISNWYKAEEYHQNYYAQNGNAGYCRVVIAPKVIKFRDKWKHLLKAN